jgi:DNA-3-methyladenine glycosylase
VRPRSATSSRRGRGRGRGEERAAPRPLPRRFYARRPEVVARALLGRLIVRETRATRLIGRIVEVEAYGGAGDPASHAFRGETPRNRVMFGPPGHAYVYFSYGMHHCLNVVTGRDGVASAVLIRALEPIAGLSSMARRRGAMARERLARGPGCVTRAMGISVAQDGADLTQGPLWLAALPPRRGGRRVASSPRIGIGRALSRRWRFFLAGHPCVSKGRAGRALPDRG